MYNAAQHVAESVDDKCVSVPETAKKLLEPGTGNEEAKINLSTSTSTEISLTWLAPDAKGNEHFIRTLTRDMLEELAAPIVSRCREKCEETVRDSELQLDEIDHVLMVGGSSKIPCVRAMVEDYFGKKPSFIQAADQCVAIGTAIEGAIINGEINRMQLLDVTPLGGMTTGRIFDVIIDPNTTISTSRTIRYEAKEGAQKDVLDANFMMKDE